MALSAWHLVVLLGATFSYQVCGQSFNLACTTDPECSAGDPLTECGDNGRCRCFLGYYPNSQSAPPFLCEKIVGSACTSGGECFSRGDPETRCVDNNNDGTPDTCECNIGYYLDGSIGLCTAVFGSSCNVSSECRSRSGGNQYYSCVDTDNNGSPDSCRCGTGAYLDNNSVTCAAVYNSTCVNDTMCTSRGDSNLVCSSGRCLCSAAFYSNPMNANKCEEVFGSPCTASSQCQSRGGSNQYYSCVDTDNDGSPDSCGCGAGAYFDSNSMTCSAVYNSMCTSTSQCSDRSNNTLYYCVDTDNDGTPDRCRCIPRAYSDNGVCIYYYGSPCTNGSQCTSRGDPNSDCKDTNNDNTPDMCLCRDHYYFEASVFVCANAFNSSCLNDITCVSRGDWNLFCADTDANGSPDTCRCTWGTFPAAYADYYCLQLIGSTCSSDSDCVGRGDPASRCNSQTQQCECKPGYYTNALSRRCERTLGSLCGNNTDCTNRDTDTVCSKTALTDPVGTCGCQNGYLENEVQPICLEKKLGLPCMTTGHCLKISNGAQCNSQGTCECGPGYLKDPTGKTCGKAAVLGEICDPSLTACEDQNAECRWDGSTGRAQRCQCKDQYVETGDPTNNQCAFELTSLDDIWCKPCEDNDGYCFDVNGDLQADGCLCPPSRSGQRCEKNHVIVSCSNDTMKICYQPHNDVNLTTGMIAAEDQYTKALCRGRPNDVECGSGQYLLTLSLDDYETCNTKRTQPTLDTFRFENVLAIQSSRDSFGQRGDRKIDVFCSYRKYIKQTFQGIGVDGSSGNSAGEHRNPVVTSTLRNSLGQLIPNNVAMAIGDKVQLDISLVKDGVYNAIRIKECTASNQPILTGMGALRLPLLDDGCPAGSQTYFTKGNVFSRVNGEANQLRSGLIEVFRISRGTSLFLHCTLEVCMQETDCGISPCAMARRSAALTSAKKRSTSYSVVQQIRTYDPNEEYGKGGPSTVNGDSTSSTTIIVLLAVIAVVVLVAVGVISVLATKLSAANKGQKEEEEELEEYTNCSIPRIDPDRLRS